MIAVDVPGFGSLRLRHALMDFNGTLACDGALLDGVRERLGHLATQLHLHIATADTNGTARAALSGLPVEIRILARDGQAKAKRDIVDALGAGHTVAFGNGRNDRLMLARASLSIAVRGVEGSAVEALHAAHIVCDDARDALDLLVIPNRLIATLRD
jgi:soluble P-type ATPase